MINPANPCLVFSVLALRRGRLLVGLLVTSFALAAGVLRAAEVSAEAWLKQAAALEQAGKFREAGVAYGKAAEVLEAAGKSAEQAGALEKSAAMYEKWADSLQAGAPVAKAPAVAAPVTPAVAPAPAQRPAPVAAVAPAAAPKPLPPVAAKRGFIVGRAVTEAGAPLAAFKVYCSGFEKGKFQIQDAHVGAISNFSVVTDGKAGQFSTKVPDGLFDTNAWLELTWHGKAYKLPLAPEPRNYDFPNQHLQYLRDGLVHNYVWKISGVRGVTEGEPTPLGWYGGLIHVDCDTIINGYGQQSLAYAEPNGSQVEITLVPQEPLIDGSTGTTLVRRIPLHLGGFITDVPVGYYTATARVIGPNGASKALKLSSTPATFANGHLTIAWQQSAPVIFPPSDVEYSAVNPMGLGRCDLYLGEPDALGAPPN